MIERSGHVVLREWEIRNPESGTALAGLSLAGGQPVQALAQMLSKESVLDVAELRSGLRIQTFSHVGRVRLGDLTITVRPKLDHATLLNLLRYAYGFRRLRLFEEAAQRLEAAAFEDLLIAQLHAEVAELIARGLHRSYVARREPLASPRGRIDVHRLAAGGGIVTSTLPCIHYPRIEDSLLNQVLLAGLHLAGQAASDLQLRRTSRRLAGLLAERVSSIRLDAGMLTSVRHHLNRLTAAYEPSINIIRLLAESQGVSLGESDAMLSLPGFLFDMNRFFQALLSRFLRENLADCIVRDEYRLRGMMRYVPEFNPRKRKSPDPRPDFVVQRGPHASAILDAKYRDLWEHGLPRDMLYQLALYASSHHSKTATILYPTTQAAATEARIEVRDPVSYRQLAQVRSRPVYLGRFEELVLAKPSAAMQRRRAAYADWLAFGDSAKIRA